MHRSKTMTMAVISALFLLLITATWLATATPASAQCGSQASSCKSCHEVQGELPVNNDGKAWHSSHAFGDFCYICHAGNNQAQDKAQAHTGLAAPLADVKASCQQCHPSDLTERAQVYASALGVEIGAGSPAPDSAAAQPAAESPSSPAVAPSSTAIDFNDPNLVDYNARYDEIVLGKRPVNWGNVILLGMIGVVAVGGGGFVVTRERLLKISFGDVQQAGAEYPAEVVELLPSIAALKPASRKSLKNVLANPRADKVLGLMDAVVSPGKEEE